MGRISHALERYDYILENGQQLFIMEDNDHGYSSSTFDPAMVDKYSNKWLEAMQLEIDFTHAN